MAVPGATATATLTLTRRRNFILGALLALAASSWGILAWQSYSGPSPSASGGTASLLTMGMGVPLFMAMWTAAMWIVENVLRPVLTAHRAEVSTLAIFVGAIGGASAFGVLGLVIGPVLLSFAVALLRFAEEEVAKG